MLELILEINLKYPLARTKNLLANSKTPVLEIKDFWWEIARPKYANTLAYSEATRDNNVIT